MSGILGLAPVAIQALRNSSYLSFTVTVDLPVKLA
jgi:hypothetical protein